MTALGAETQSWLQDNYAAGDSWVSLSSFAGPDGTTGLYALPYKIDVKSLVWYVPENFEDAGYTVPETLEDLKALTEQIVADGGTPWCIGLGSGGATGWPATDWVEDLMLRLNPPEVYDQWVSHEIPFSDPQVLAAIDEFGWFAKNDSFVAGDRPPYLRPTSTTAPRDCSPRRRNATCTIRPASSPRSSPKARNWAPTRTFSTCPLRPNLIWAHLF